MLLMLFACGYKQAMIQFIAAPKHKHQNPKSNSCHPQELTPHHLTPYPRASATDPLSRVHISQLRMI